jgi:hypothetical protein
MTDENDALGQWLAYIRSAEQSHIDLAGKAWQADNGAIFPADLIVVGALQRSLGLIEGFTSLVEQNNDVCAIPLLRLQIDTVLRLYASTLFPSGGGILEEMLADTPLYRVKAPNGEKLTDGYLCKLAATHFPWLPDAYKRTSATVHMSRPALMSSLREHGDDRTFTILIGSAERQRWSDAEKRMAVQLFAQATEAVCQLVDSWIDTKEARAAERTAARPPDEI